MVEIKDILIKAAEDVQSGMWCQGGWFVDDDGEGICDDGLFFRSLQTGGDFGIEEALQSRRCAEGSLAVAAALLGDRGTAYRQAMFAVNDRLGATGVARTLLGFNDCVLPIDADPFAAGQQLAELFRSTAETL